ncbi:heterokaryon incompatibility protein-domain-containing protein [Hypomontagnella monticulosa]|nr:heterokaryon incompatibility protein-domain-containing protein [Hypomontagnella monticulosa]
MATDSPDEAVVDVSELGPADDTSESRGGNIPVVDISSDTVQTIRDILAQDEHIEPSSISPEDISTMRTVRVLGQVYLERGDYHTAEPLLRTALSELDRIAGRLSEDSLDTLCSLATVLAQLGNFNESESLFRRAALGYLKVEPPDSRSSVLAVQRLCWAYAEHFYQLIQCNRLDSIQRLEFFELPQSFISACKILPIPQVASVLGDLGRILAWNGDIANASSAVRWKYAPGIGNYNSWHACNGCGQIISSLPLSFCRTCRDVELCPACYRPFEDRVPSCKTHRFLTVEEESPKPEPDSFKDWLQIVAEAIHGAGLRPIQPRISLSVLRDRGDNMLSAASNNDNTIPDLVPMRMARLSMKAQATIAVPRMKILMDHVFSADGFNNRDLPQLVVTPQMTDEELSIEYLEYARRIITTGSEPQPSDTISNSSIKNGLKINPLPPDSIYAPIPLDAAGLLFRLLQLLPGDTEPLQCNLTVHTTSAAPVYEALSYVWGTQASQGSHAIKVNGVDVYISTNLHAALTSLRDSTTSRILWVDAICINQQDNQEKGVQVSKIVDIYKNAFNVVAYIGEDNGSYTDLFNFFNRDRKDESFNEATARLGIEKIPMMENFLEFCRTEWWTRVWIQQEYALPLEDPTFQVGKLQTKGSCVAADSRAFIEEDTAMIESDDNTVLYHSVKKVSQWLKSVPRALQVLRLRFPVDEPHLTYSLGEILRQTPWSRCSDPRDIIFGRQVFLEKCVQILFKPDYSMSKETLFQQVAIWLLVYEHDLDIFWRYPHRLSHQLPSWVPDFSKMREEGGIQDVSDRIINTSIGMVIYKGVFAVYGRHLDIISQVFSVDDEDVFGLLRKLWLLDNAFSALRKEAHLRRLHPLSSALPHLYEQYFLSRLLLGMNTKGSIISYHLPGMPKQETLMIVREVIDPVISQFEQLRRQISDSLDEIDTHTRKYEIREIGSELSRIQIKLYRVPMFLAGLDLSTDIPCASIFDYDNLSAQIKDLRAPKNAKPAGCLDQVINSLLKKIHIPDVPTRGTTLNVVDGSPFPWLPKPSHDDLQAAVCDSPYEEEVRLFAKLVLQVAWRLTSAMDDKKSVSDPSQPQQHNRSQEDHDTVVGGLFIAELIRATSHATFFVTECGLIGVEASTKDIKIGDHLIMLENYKLPMVIRPEQDPKYHSIIGISNVCGLDGEEFHRLEEDKKPGERFYKFK